MKGPSRATEGNGWAGLIAANGGRPSPLTRVCPKCEARIGWRCHYWVNGAQRFKAEVHSERRRKAERRG